MEPSSLTVMPAVLGPFQTNTYLLADVCAGLAAVIDPAWGSRELVQEAQQQGWRIGEVWLTHAHIDHIAGVRELVEGLDPPPRVALHPLDHPLWRQSGGMGWFGLPAVPMGPPPAFELADRMLLRLGALAFEVRHSPGHSPGHVMFYCAQQACLFSGDLLFAGGVGRTDLQGGDWETLLASIREQAFSLPDEVRVFPGHGPSTTIGQERRANPFLVE